MTLDLYGHLFPDQLDEVGDRLDSAARRAGVYPMCTEPKLRVSASSQKGNGPPV